jgi:hypothetical protein
MTEKSRLSADFADFEIQVGEICGSPWSSGYRRKWRMLKAERAKAVRRCRPVENNAIEAEASACATLRANGIAPASGYPRAEALPKVRTMFEDAHPFREVRILENPGDSFEDAHPFPRCARKLSTFEWSWAGSGVAAGSQALSRAWRNDVRRMSLDP